MFSTSKTIKFFNNIVSLERAKELHSASIARSIKVLFKKYNLHSRNYSFFCFEGRIFRLLFSVLHSRKHLNLLCKIKKTTLLAVYADNNNSNLIAFIQFFLFYFIGEGILSFHQKKNNNLVFFRWRLYLFQKQLLVRKF